MEKMVKNKNMSLISGAILLLIVWYIMPLARYYIRDFYALIYGFILCVFCAFESKECSRYLLFSFLIGLSLSWIISVFAYNFAFQPFYALFIHLLLYFSIPPTLFLYIRNKMCQSEIDFFIKAIWVIILTVYISSFIVLLSFPEAARSLASGSASEQLLNSWRRSNVGGFNFTYSMGLLFLLIIYRLKNIKGFLKVAYVIMLISMIYYFVMAQYVTLLIIVFITSMLLLIIQNKKNGAILTLLGIPILFFLLNASSFFRFFAEIMDSEIISRRLYEVAEFLGGGEMGTSLESRWNVYTEGIQYFLKSPIWGNSVETYGGVDIWHSTVIEYMVKSGIIGVTIYFILLRNATIKTLVVERKRKSSLVIPCVIYTVVLSILNPTQYAHEMAILLWLFIPLNILKEENTK